MALKASGAPGLAILREAAEVLSKMKVRRLAVAKVAKVVEEFSAAMRTTEVSVLLLHVLDLQEP
eukprot:6862520-Prorocentrum_lima.AAC.1